MLSLLYRHSKCSDERISESVGAKLLGEQFNVNEPVTEPLKWSREPAPAPAPAPALIFPKLLVITQGSEEGLVNRTFHVRAG